METRETNRQPTHRYQRISRATSPSVVLRKRLRINISRAGLCPIVDGREARPGRPAQQACWIIPPVRNPERPSVFLV